MDASDDGWRPGAEGFPHRHLDRKGDDWQRRHFGENNPKGSPGRDPDQDGQDNLHEYLAGTDPTDANSRFNLRIEKAVGLPGMIKLTFSPRLESRTYGIEVSTNLVANSFARWEGVKVENQGPSGILFDLSATHAAHFYRIRISIP